MEKHRAIPPGYMTVGELAKKMDITVRTLQYYDTLGLLAPTAESEGGRRLYTSKDLIKLHQILSLKSVGFSLEDIKSRVPTLDSPADVAEMLAQQAAELEGKLQTLTESLREIRLLQAEVLQMQTVDFNKYADIIVNLQMKNEHYWLIKHFDNETLDYLRSRFDRESGLDFLSRFSSLNDEVLRLHEHGVPPESQQGQQLAKKFWEIILEFTEGDLSMLPKLMEMGDFDKAEGACKEKMALVNQYIEAALDVYFTKQGYDPLEETTK